MSINIKHIGFLILFSTIKLSVLAQTNAHLIHEFNTTVIKNIKYPTGLIEQGKPTATMLKIDINEKGTVKSLQLSDSADSLFNSAFLSGKKNLDVSSIVKYARNKKLRNISILIPVYISFTSNLGELKGIEINQLKYMMQFENRPFSGNSVILPPIYHTFVFNRDY